MAETSVRHSTNHSVVTERHAARVADVPAVLGHGHDAVLALAVRGLERRRRAAVAALPAAELGGAHARGGEDARLARVVEGEGVVGAGRGQQLVVAGELLAHQRADAAREQLGVAAAVGHADVETHDVVFGLGTSVLRSGRVGVVVEGEGKGEVMMIQVQHSPTDWSE